jgi:ornithine cyclodeaminase/alanine dehydrogenase-like protein (mu-crystallin family)
MPSPPAPAIFSADDTREILPWLELIDAVGRAFDRTTSAPPRLVLGGDGCDWVVMPGSAPNGGIACKLLRVGHGDGARVASTIGGVIVLLDAAGRLVAVLDGATLTARRTAAVAAFATSLLARPDASVLAVFGAGALAETHVDAIAEVRQLTEIRVVGRSTERLPDFCRRLSTRGHDVVATDARTALRGASIVVTATTSATPVFADEDLAPGTHVNAMGSYRPERAEIPAKTVARARVVVETLETAWSEAGDLIQACEVGLIDERHVWAELHERERIAALRAEEPDAITLFKSVGHVALDLAALDLALAQLHAFA